MLEVVVSPLMSSYLLVGRVGTCTGSPAPPEWSVTGGSARVEERNPAAGPVSAGGG